MRVKIERHCKKRPSFGRFFFLLNIIAISGKLYRMWSNIRTGKGENRHALLVKGLIDNTIPVRICNWHGTCCGLPVRVSVRDKCPTT
jgi:hypothetical protein